MCYVQRVRSTKVQDFKASWLSGLWITYWPYITKMDVQRDSELWNPRMVSWKFWTPGCHQLFSVLRKKHTPRDIWNWKKIAGTDHSWIHAPFHSRKTVWCQFSFFNQTCIPFLPSPRFISYFAYVANMIWWVWSVWASQSIEEMIAEGDCWFILVFSTKNKHEYKWLQGFPGGPAVKTAFQSRECGSTLGWGTKVLHVSWSKKWNIKQKQYCK